MDTLLAALAALSYPTTAQAALLALAQLDPVTAGATKLPEYGAIGLLALCALYALKVMWVFASDQAAGRLADRDKHGEKYEKLLRETTEALTQVRTSLDAIVAATTDDPPEATAPAPTKGRADGTNRSRRQTE